MQYAFIFKAVSIVAVAFPKFHVSSLGISEFGIRFQLFFQRFPDFSLKSSEKIYDVFHEF